MSSTTVVVSGSLLFDFKSPPEMFHKYTKSQTIIRIYTYFVGFSFERSDQFDLKVK